MNSWFRELFQFSSQVGLVCILQTKKAIKNSQTIFSHQGIRNWLGPAGRSSVTGYLEEGLGGQKIEKIGKLGSGGLTRTVFSHASLLRRTVLYTVSRAREGGRARVSRTLSTVGWSQQKANQAMLHEGNTRSLKCITVKGLGTDNHNPYRRVRAELSGWSYSSPQGPSPGHYWPCQAYSGF